jgi:hypothetical protein
VLSDVVALGVPEDALVSELSLPQAARPKESATETAAMAPVRRRREVVMGGAFRRCCVGLVLCQE